MNVYAKFRCALLKKALGIFGQLIATTTTTTTTTRVAFWDPSSGSKKTCSITIISETLVIGHL